MTKELITELEKLFADYGVPARGRGRRFPDPVKSRILTLMQSGVSVSSLSRATGISVMTLGSWKEQSKSKHFQRITVAQSPPRSDGKFRLYIGDKVWLELDEASIRAGILQKIRAAL
ncbi:MAG: transposase [Pseudobdellovibrionaceae bacterium]|nr:transposase [Pseudobdellovibrionaceae bacterium]